MTQRASDAARQRALTARRVADGFDADSRATRKVRAAYCEKCRANVMRGLPSDLVTWEVLADPGALSPFGEAIAKLAGRRTIALQWAYDHYQFVDNRDQFTIPAQPAGSIAGTDVLVIHECFSTVHFASIHSRVDELRKSSLIDPIDPPF